MIMPSDPSPHLRMIRLLLVGAFVGLFGGAVATVIVVTTAGPQADPRAVAESALATAPGQPFVPAGVHVVLVPPARSTVEVAGRPPWFVVATDARTVAQAIESFPESGSVASASGGGWWAVVSVEQTQNAWPGALAVGAVTLLTAVATAVIGGLIIDARRIDHRGSEHAGPGSIPAEVAIEPTPEPDAVVADRTRTQADRAAVLVRGLADLESQLPEEYAWQAERILQAGGVEPVRPDGQRFDPAIHHSIGTEPAPDTRLVNTIARTIRRGYRDDREILVPPRVVVFADPARGKGGPR